MGLVEKAVIPGSHCVFYFKDLKEKYLVAKCTASLIALCPRKH